jgi:hypothetical protein
MELGYHVANLNLCAYNYNIARRICCESVARHYCSRYHDADDTFNPNHCYRYSYCYDRCYNGYSYGYYGYSYGYYGCRLIKNDLL